MTVGASGSYAIQGTNLSLQPTRGRWLDRDSFGFDGGGHPIYPAVRSFEMSWQLINAGDIAQLISFYNQVQNTGSVAVDLPKWAGNPYQFERYSGCVLSEPMVDEYFNEHTTQVRMIVYNIV